MADPAGSSDKAVTRVRIRPPGRLTPCRRFHLLPRAAVPRPGFSVRLLHRLPESQVVPFSFKGGEDLLEHHGGLPAHDIEPMFLKLVL